MMKQLEQLAKIVLKEDGAAFKKSTSGEWILRFKADVGPLADFFGGQAEALALLNRYQPGIQMLFTLN